MGGQAVYIGNLRLTVMGFSIAMDGLTVAAILQVHTVLVWRLSILS